MPVVAAQPIAYVPDATARMVNILLDKLSAVR